MKTSFTERSFPKSTSTHHPDSFHFSKSLAFKNNAAFYCSEFHFISKILEASDFSVFSEALEIYF
jgi:hypothetical protein